MKRLELLRPGQRIDSWVVLDLIGQGGMAAVYRVRHTELGRVAALKVVAVPGRQIMDRLRQEGRAQSRVQHRNVLAVQDVLDVEGSPGLLMDYVAGPPLDLLIEQIALELPQVDGLARGMMRGLAAAHEAGLVHRDLKPANVLVAIEPEGLVPKIADFGLAKDFVAGGSATRTGAFMGTPNYMSPEQIRDPRNVDARSDVFALGAVLYELVARRRAFEHDDALELFNRIARGEYTPIEEVRPDVPARMAKAIAAALQPDRERRPASCTELLAVWAEDVPDSALVASWEGLDRSLLERVRSLVSLPPSVPSDPTNATFADDPVPDEPPAIPATPRGGRALLAGGVGALGLAGCAGALGVGVLALSALLMRSPGPAPVPVPVPVPVPAPAPAPAPVPVPVPVPAPAPVPVPVPVPVQVPAPTPRPAPVPEAPTPVEPPAPPPAPTTGSVLVEGTALEVLLRDEQGRFVKPGPTVPPGTYAVLATFAEGEKPLQTLPRVQVVAGAQLHIVCGLRRCNVR